MCGLLGRALLQHFGLTLDDPETWVYLVEGHAFTSLDAMIRAGRRVGGLRPILQPLRLFPRPVQDWLYRWLAQTRYQD
jgi:predicted DCC family thiol-disulfide oxidoreductase YuxK